MDIIMLKAIVNEFVSSFNDKEGLTGTLISMVRIPLTEYTEPIEDTFRRVAIKQDVKEMKKKVLDKLDGRLYEYSELVLNARVARFGYTPNLYEQDLMAFESDDSRKYAITSLERELYYALETEVELKDVIFGSDPIAMASTLHTEMTKYGAKPEDIFLSVHQWERGDIHKRTSYAVNLHEYLTSSLTIKTV